MWQMKQEINPPFSGKTGSEIIWRHMQFNHQKEIHQRIQKSESPTVASKSLHEPLLKPASARYVHVKTEDIIKWVD